MSPVVSLNPWFPPLAAGVALKPLRAIGLVGVEKTCTGIAHICAAKGMGVMMHDREAGALTHAVENVRALFRAAEGRNEISHDAAHRAMGGISITTGLEDLEFCDIIIEAVTEDAASKQVRFREFDRLMPKDMVLASCASAPGLAELGTLVAAPERLLGLRFFDPVSESKQVQLTLAPATARETAERVIALIAALGRQPIVQGPAPR